MSFFIIIFMVADLRPVFGEDSYVFSYRYGMVVDGFSVGLLPGAV